MLSVSNESSEVYCKHGPAECIGNILILCALNLPFPGDDGLNLEGPGHSSTPTVRYLGFANCLISSYTHIPERLLVQNCALEHGIDFDALNRCASEEKDGNDSGSLSGLALLRESALRSDALDVRLSCTVRLDEKVWCVRDDGTWKNCAQGGRGSEVSTFVPEIERLWKEKNP